MAPLAMLVVMGVMVARTRKDGRRLKQANARLGELLDGAQRLAREDPLTGLPNRRAFLERLAEELSRARRSGDPVCIAYLDVDNFKNLNDKRGHTEGNEFLRRIARAIRETVRNADAAARLGGDEFAVLFADPTRIAVEPRAHRLLARVRALGERYPGLDLGAPVGMAWVEPAPDHPQRLLQRAEGAMCSAKSAGKPRFALWAADADKPVVQT